MSVIDLDEYPDGTEEILMVLWEYEQNRRHDELQNEWMKRRMLASRTSLNKQQVRYRLKRLVEDGYVTQDVIPEHNQRVTIYALPPNGKKSAKAIGEVKDVLGEIPEEFEKQDILMLTYELATARAEAEIGRANADSSIVIQRLNEIDKRLDEIDNNANLANRMNKLETRLDEFEDEFHNLFIKVRNNIEKRMSKIERNIPESE